MEMIEILLVALVLTGVSYCGEACDTSRTMERCAKVCRDQNEKMISYTSGEGCKCGPQ